MQRLTSFVTYALAPGSKIQGFSHCQLGLVQIVLVYIGCCVNSLELVEVLAIVCDVATQLDKQLHIILTCP